ncbi:hypothetical protein N9L68_06405 [bacterium]|nr:hypothetical protein [bacterium]
MAPLVTWTQRGSRAESPPRGVWAAVGSSGSGSIPMPPPGPPPARQNGMSAQQDGRRARPLD